MIQFDISGPVFEKDGTSFHFKRVTFNSIHVYNLKNSIFNDMSKERQKEFEDRAKRKEKNWDHYTPTEKAELVDSPPRFCLDFCEKIVDLDSEVPYEKFNEDQKITFWQFMLEDEEFVGWLVKYKLGSEKKPGSVDEGD